MRGRCAAMLRSRRRAHRLLLAATLLPALMAACASERAPQRHVVEMSEFAFSPDTVRAAPGDTIVWINRDMVPHTATAAEGAWDSGAVAAQGSWSHVAAVAGESAYLCTLHPSMTGVILVAEEE